VNENRASVQVKRATCLEPGTGLWPEPGTRQTETGSRQTLHSCYSHC
jgi:hypothetical protein